MPLALEWMDEFVRDVGVPPMAPDLTGQRIARGQLYFWGDGENPRAMVAWGRETPSGCAINTVYTPQRVAEMFLLRPDVPRSLRRCLIEVRENLKVVANHQSARTERLVGALQAQLEFGEAAELAPERLRGYLTDKIEQLGRIGDGIARDFLISEAVA